MDFIIDNIGTISIAGGVSLALYFIIRFTKSNSDNNSNSGNVTINQKGGKNSGHIASGRDTNIKSSQKFLKMVEINQDSGDNSLNIASGRDTNILIQNDQLVRKLQENYTHIYHWLRKFGTDAYKRFAGENPIKEVEEYIKNIPKPEFAEISEMLNVAEEIKNGLLTFIALKPSIIDNSIYISDYANQIIKIHISYKIDILPNQQIDNNQNFYENAYEKALKKDKDLQTIYDQKLENQNIGGIVSTLQTNKQLIDSVVATPMLLGFSKVNTPNSLVNLAKSQRIKIVKVELIGVSGTDHKVKLQVANLTDETINCFIPKGQIFENKDYNTETQNLALAEDTYFTLKPKQQDEIPLKAYCLNEDFGSPSGTLGNISIYEVANKKYKNGDELWKQMRAIQTNIQEYLNRISN